MADIVHNNSTGGLCPRRTLFAANNVRGGKKSAANTGGLCPRRKTLADFLADRPPGCGGSDWIRGGSARVRQSPPKSPPMSAQKKSPADTGADSGGHWRIRRGQSPPGIVPIEASTQPLLFVYKPPLQTRVVTFIILNHATFNQIAQRHTFPLSNFEIKKDILVHNSLSSSK